MFIIEMKDFFSFSQSDQWASTGNWDKYFGS